MWHGTGDVRLDEVPDPKVLEPSDAIVRITGSAICGTDLVVSGTVDLNAFVTRRERPTNAVEVYEAFDGREEGWLRTVLDVA
ncbi:hypothetical protein ACRAKI_22680 [Saccharothrix isguenensis]